MRYGIWTTEHIATPEYTGNFFIKEGIMATVLTEKHHGIFEVCSNCCQSAIKGFCLIAGGIGGFIILAILLFPLLLIGSFLLKVIGL